MKKLWEQVDKIKELYPGKAVNLSLNLWDFSFGDKETGWSLYITEVINLTFPSFSALQTYVKGLSEDDNTEIETEMYEAEHRKDVEEGR